MSSRVTTSQEIKGANENQRKELKEKKLVMQQKSNQSISLSDICSLCKQQKQVCLKMNPWGDGVHNGRNRPPLMILRRHQPRANLFTNREIALLDRLWKSGISEFAYLLRMAYLQQYGHVVDDTEENSNTDIDDIDVTDDEDSTEVHRDPDDNSDRIQSDLLDTSDINDGDEEGAGANSVVTVHHFLEERALLPEGMRSAPQEEDGRVNQRFRFWDHDSERNEVEW